MTTGAYSHPKEDLDFMQLLADEDIGRHHTKGNDRWKHIPSHAGQQPLVKSDLPETPIISKAQFTREPNPQLIIIKRITLPPADSLFEPEPDYTIKPLAESNKPIKNFKIPNYTSKNPFYQQQLAGFRVRMQTKYGIKV